MANFLTQLRMCVGASGFPDAYKYSYVFFTEAGTPGEAISNGISIWEDALRQCHGEVAFCYEIYASDLLPDTTNFSTGAMPSGLERGTVGMGGSTNLYNPNHAVRIDLPVAGGFPSRKWLRLGFLEEWIAPGGLQIGSTAIIEVLDEMRADLGALSFLRDESGGTYFGTPTFEGFRTKRLGKFARFDLPPFPAFG